MTELLTGLLEACVGLAFLGLPVLVVALAVFLVVTPDRRRWVRGVAAGLGSVAVAAVLLYVVLWGIGFDEADALREVPPAVTYGGDVAVAVLLLCGLALGGLAVTKRPARRT